MAAQLVHAAGESMEFGSFMGELSSTYCEVCTKRPGRSSAYPGCGHCAGHGQYPEPIHVVVLAVDNEAQLLELDARLDAGNIAHRSVREPVAPWNGALMAIGFEPVKNRSVLRKYISSIPLLREGSSVVRVPLPRESEVGGSSPSPRTNSSADSSTALEQRLKRTEIAGSSPVSRTNTEVAQRVERLPFEEGGGGAGPPLGAE